MKNSHLIIAVCLPLVATAAVGAGYITLSTSDGLYEMKAGEFSGLLSGNDHLFSMNEASILASTLNNDGIDTTGKLSFILASTDAGLSFMGLFDGQGGGDSGDPYYFGLSSTTSISTAWFGTNHASSHYDWYDLGNGFQMVNALFASSPSAPTAFAWGDVHAAPSATFNLYDLDLTEFGGYAIQFVTFDNDEWSVLLEADFSVLGEYAFSYQFVPAPGAIVLLLVSGLARRRKRRT